MGRIATIVALSMALFGGIAGYAAHDRLAAQSAAAADTCQTFPETGKTVCGLFLQYWREHGGLAQQGLPLSDAFNERSTVDGKVYLVQYFERAVFEHHPENPPPYDVLLSLLGREQYRTRYGSVSTTRPAIVGQQILVRGLGDAGNLTMRVEALDLRENVTLVLNDKPYVPSGKFVVVFARITNLGDSRGMVFNAPASLLLADQHNREAHLSTASRIADIAAQTYRLDVPYVRIEPGLAADVVMVYDVPSDATDFRLVVGAGYQPK